MFLFFLKKKKNLHCFSFPLPFIFCSAHKWLSFIRLLYVQTCCFLDWLCSTFTSVKSIFLRSNSWSRSVYQQGTFLSSRQSGEPVLHRETIEINSGLFSLLRLETFWSLLIFQSILCKCWGGSMPVEPQYTSSGFSFEDYKTFRNTICVFMFLSY